MTEKTLSITLVLHLLYFYNSETTTLVVSARIAVEMGSHLTKNVPVQSHNSFLDQRSRKVIV